jgi:alpha-mannosidase
VRLHLVEVNQRETLDPRPGKHLGDRHLKPPVSRLVQARGDGPLLPEGSFLGIEGDFAALSSLYPSTATDAVVARIYDTQGNGGTVRLSGPLTEASAAAMNLLEEDPQPLAGQPGEWRVELPAWRIQTVILTR